MEQKSLIEYVPLLADSIPLEAIENSIPLEAIEDAPLLAESNPPPFALKETIRVNRRFAAGYQTHKNREQAYRQGPH